MFEIRTITADDADLFRRRLSRGFGSDVDEDEWAAERFTAIFEFDRTLAVLDGGDIIGTGGAFSLGVTVPGGAVVPMAGTTVISVQPTHRRRGVLRSLMSRHLDDVAEHGEALAGLWASESSIYDRFGYGPATYRQKAVVGASSLRFRDEDAKGSVRLAEPEEALDILRPVFEDLAGHRPGMLTRSEQWWTHRVLADPATWRGSRSSKRHALFEEDGKVTGYATYRQKEKWEDFMADGEVDVVEVVTTSNDSHTGLWSFLTHIDLFPRVEWWNMPIDDPLPLKITDPRRVRRSVSDALWIRLMDVPKALSARGYETDGVVSFEVNDPVRPENSGSYRLECSDGVGVCERLDKGAIALDVDVLGHLYLGGGDAMAMAAAGRIEGDPGAIRTLHRLFRTDQPPWCPEVF